VKRRTNFFGSKRELGDYYHHKSQPPPTHWWITSAAHFISLPLIIVDKTVVGTLFTDAFVIHY
jgi:hypothetical protein